MDNGVVGWNFDLSLNKSLRTLETTAHSMVARDTNPDFLTTVLSTVIPSLPLDVVVIYDALDFDFLEWDFVRKLMTKTESSLWHQERLGLFRKMYQVREFQLVLCADVPDVIVKYSMRTLGGIVMAEKAKGGLDYLRHEPLIISEERILYFPKGLMIFVLVRWRCGLFMPAHCDEHPLSHYSQLFLLHCTGRCD